MNQTCCLSLLMLLSSLGNLHSQVQEPRLALTPSLGFSGILFSSDGRPVNSLGLSGSVAGEYRIFGNFSLGARLGSFLFFSDSGLSATPTAAGIVSYDFSRDFTLGLEAGILPAVSLTFRDHQLALGILPFYMISGGATYASLQYGYRFKL